jgi:hypothetical protein
LPRPKRPPSRTCAGAASELAIEAAAKIIDKDIKGAKGASLVDNTIASLAKAAELTSLAQPNMRHVNQRTPDHCVNGWSGVLVCADQHIAILARQLGNLTSLVLITHVPSHSTENSFR